MCVTGSQQRRGEEREASGWEGHPAHWPKGMSRKGTDTQMSPKTNLC